MKQYKEFIIKTTPYNPDLVSGFLWELNIIGLNESEDSLIVFAEEKSILTLEDVSNKLKILIVNKVIDSFDVKEKLIEGKNWNEEWEKRINVVEVSEHIVIKPSFKNYDNKQNKIVITIDPKMSFGTGEHETTKLVIQLLEKYIKKGMRTLDVGMGTGILAIASIKLGAKYALAIDNDEWSFENANENCRFNNVSKKVEINLSEIEQVKEDNFDIILANIQKNVLVDINKEIIKRLSKNGITILSGLLIEDERDIVDKYKELELIERETMGDWLALVFQK